MKRLCVFCGSCVGSREVYAASARRLGEVLAGRGLELVFGAGHVGMMGVLADAVLVGGGRAIGVIPQALVDKELAHAGLSELRVVATMHQRKALMEELSDGFAALPGGFGTLDELFEILTWSQLGLHRKPIGLLDVSGYWRPLLGFLEHAVNERFLRAEHLATLLVERDPGQLLDRLGSHQPRALDKWLDGGGAA